MLSHVLDTGGCVCCVRNTVDDALDAYREWVPRLGEERVMLFHARFALADRLSIENEVLRVFGPSSTSAERRGRLLIATQVAEQSLDLDFDGMVSDLAPIDLLIQRAGRLKRHLRDSEGNAIAGRDQRGSVELGVFLPEPTLEADARWFADPFPRAARVYPHHGQLWLTARWLTARGGFSMPEDARDMIESVYGASVQAEIPEGLRAVSIRAEGDSGAMSAQGRLNSLQLDEGYVATMTHWQDDAYAPTRLGEPTVTVRLAKSERRALDSVGRRRSALRLAIVAAHGPARPTRRGSPGALDICARRGPRDHAGSWQALRRRATGAAGRCLGRQSREPEEPGNPGQLRHAIRTSVSGRRCFMNLIENEWIPARRRSGQIARIAPWQLTEGLAEDPFIQLAAPRPDFNGALIQFLIGLLQTCFAPEDQHEWRQRLRQAPTSEELKKAFLLVRTTFRPGRERPSIPPGPHSREGHRGTRTSCPGGEDQAGWRHPHRGAYGEDASRQHRPVRKARPDRLAVSGVCGGRPSLPPDKRASGWAGQPCRHPGRGAADDFGSRRLPLGHGLAERTGAQGLPQLDGEPRQGGGRRKVSVARPDADERGWPRNHP